MKIEVPKAVHMAHLERTCFALGEFDVLPVVTLLARTKQRAALHEAADRRVGRHGAEPGVLSSERGEVVVMELERPSRMLFVLTHDCFGECVGHARLRAGVTGHLPRERSDRIGDVAGGIEPTLDRLERKSNALAAAGMSPRPGGKRLDPHLELAILGGSGEKRSND